MDKPEDIAQWAWDEASKCVPNYVKRTIVEGIARAILSAQSQAYIDAARIAENYRGPNGRFERDEPDKTVYGWGTARRAISAAILQRKEEMK